MNRDDSTTDQPADELGRTALTMAKPAALVETLKIDLSSAGGNVLGPDSLGFWATGDYGEFDADGFLRVIGRKSEVFKPFRKAEMQKR